MCGSCQLSQCNLVRKDILKNQKFNNWISRCRIKQKKKKLTLGPYIIPPMKTLCQNSNWSVNIRNYVNFKEKIKILVTLDSVKIKKTKYYTRHRKREQCLIRLHWNLTSLFFRRYFKTWKGRSPSHCPPLLRSFPFHALNTLLPQAIYIEERSLHSVSTIQIFCAFDPFPDASEGDDLLPVGTEDHTLIWINEETTGKS